MPITNPNSGAVHINGPLTNFAIKWLQDQRQFVSLSAFPNMPVMQQSNNYHEFDLESWLTDTAKERADGDPASQSGWKMSEETYRCKVYADAKPVTDRQRANQDASVNLERSAVQYVMQKLMIRRETQLVDAFFKTNLWFNGGSSASGGENVNWGSGGTSPVKGIRDGARAVHARTGIRPNRLLIGRQAYDTLLDNGNIIDRISGAASTADPAMTTRRVLESLFEVDSIHVLGGVSQTASGTRGFIGSADQALLYYAPATSEGTEGVSAGTQFSWNAPFGGGVGGVSDEGLFIKMFRDEMSAGDIVEGNMAFDFKVTGAELGFLFTSVST